MIVRREIISDEDYAINSEKTQVNIEKLLILINSIRRAYDKPMAVTSGFRTMERHLAIYAKKGITDPKKIPMKSKHLSGEAIDISDPSQALQLWLISNPEFVEGCGLWMEDFSATPNWVHFQSIPPKSGKRYFLP